MFVVVWTLSRFFLLHWFVFVKQKSAYEMRISDWSSDLCSSDLRIGTVGCSFYGARIPRQRTRVLVCSQRTRRYLPMLGRRAAIRGQRLLVLRQGRQTGRSVGRWRRIVILYR